MNITSCSLLVSAPKPEVFAFLSDLKNMPEWATEFCQSIRQTAEGWMVQTTDEALWAEVRAEERTGVIDLRAGPTREQMGLFPIRVMTVPGATGDLTLITFTLMQGTGLEDEDYAIQYQSLQIELEGLADRFGGAVYSPMSAFNSCSYAVA